MPDCGSHWGITVNKTEAVPALIEVWGELGTSQVDYPGSKPASPTY